MLLQILKWQCSVERQTIR